MEVCGAILFYMYNKYSVLNAVWDAVCVYFGKSVMRDERTNRFSFKWLFFVESIPE